MANRPTDKPPLWSLYLIVGSILLLSLLFRVTPAGPSEVSIPYSQFKQLVANGDVTSVTFRADEAASDLREAMPIGPDDQPVSRVTTRLPGFGDPDLLPLLEQKGIEIETLPGEPGGLSPFLIGMLPWIFLLGVYWFFWRRMSRSLGGMMGHRGVDEFLTGSAKKKKKNDSGPKITFADVAGQDNAKREVAELVEFLKKPDSYLKLGAEPPKGVLLVGPPGTGKTLLARALAGESGVPFFHISASEFIEVFVGVGASRVRKMFEEAKQRAPCMIFIDELDAIGRVRGAGFGGGHDEREQTLNQILSELDGFSGREAVIVLAATNRPDVLDPALLRPGRFDRHVTLELPDRPARAAILEVHTKRVPLAADVDLALIAAGTPGFSGADLKNLVNEAAMAAARSGEHTVTKAHFDEMRDKLIMGSVRTLAIQPSERHRLAVHETGHTAVAHFLPNADPLYKVTIIPRGRALGVTHMLPEEERHTLPEDYLRDRLAVMMGGRTAERLLLGNVSSGADDDIRQATTLARAMVARWGMDEEVGPVDLRQSEEHPFLGREIAQPRQFSQDTAHEVDEAVRRFVTEAEQQATEIITTYRDQIERLVADLEASETLDRKQIEACLGERPDGKKATDDRPLPEAIKAL
ncbi:MAG: ATP-dependent zinc metalloprotease FtsH [Geminicoccales bacterium]